MSEMLHDQETEFYQGDVLEELLPPVTTVLPDIAPAPAPQVGERLGFEIPPALWRAMLACYVVFFGALLAATSASPYAIFAIVISAIYVTMFFGVSRMIVAQGPRQPRSPLAKAQGALQTIYGPLGYREVVAQMLVVPGAIAFFGVAILVIRLTVAP